MIFPSYMDAPMWRVVRKLYLNDQVVESYDEAVNLGGNESNLEYAEAEVRANGRKWKILPWLTVEAIESEIGNHHTALFTIIGDSCHRVSRIFGWDNSEPTLVTILPRDVEASWMPARWGYYIDKVPYDKICLPHHLLSDHEELKSTIEHEFMHAVTTNLTAGNAPHWLQEAMSTYAEGRKSVHARQLFATGQAKWLEPHELEGAILTDNRDAEARGKISLGYAQANLIALYLASVGGDKKLGELLRAIGNRSLLEGLKTAILGTDSVDLPLRHVYNQSERDLFEKALAWVRE